MLARKIVAGLVKTPKQAFSTYKTSTGLVGLAVDLDGRQNLINISAQVLDAVQVRIQWPFCELINLTTLWPTNLLLSLRFLINAMIIRYAMLLKMTENSREQWISSECGEMVQIYIQDCLKYPRHSCHRRWDWFRYTIPHIQHTHSHPPLTLLTYTYIHHHTRVILWTSYISCSFVHSTYWQFTVRFFAVC